MARHGENIRKRKDGRWEGRYRFFHETKGKTVYRSVYGRSYEEVKEKLSKAKFDSGCQAALGQQRETEESVHKDGGNGTVLFSQAAEEWLEEQSGKWKYSTYVKYNTIYRTHLADVAGSCQLCTAEAPKLQAKISDHFSDREMSESLWKSICCVANQILGFANRKYLTRVPLLELPFPRLSKKAPVIFSSSEQARLLDCIFEEIDKFKIAVLLCLYTGMRLGELCALRWGDIDFQNLTLTVNRTVQRIMMSGHVTRTILLETEPKSESSRRTVPLTAEMAELLLRLRAGQPYVFGREKPLEPRTMQYRFQKILKESGIDSRNFHALRHTFATNCVESNMDAKSLSEILGHSDVKITLNRYVHPTMDSKRKQIGGLSDFYGQICGQAA